jgi:hypothetical protein
LTSCYEKGSNAILQQADNNHALRDHLQQPWRGLQASDAKCVLPAALYSHSNSIGSNSGTGNKGAMVESMMLVMSAMALAAVAVVALLATTAAGQAQASHSFTTTYAG